MAFKTICIMMNVLILHARLAQGKVITPHSYDIDPELGAADPEFVACVHECELEGCYKLSNWFLNNLVDYKALNRKWCITQCTDEFSHSTTRKCLRTTTTTPIAPHSYDIDPELGAADPDFIACVHKCKLEGCYNLYDWFLNKVVDYKALNHKRCIALCTDEFRHSTTPRCPRNTTTTTMTRHPITTTSEEPTTTTTTEEPTTTTTTEEPSTTTPTEEPTFTTTTEELTTIVEGP